eukprot:6212517-Pleurochrysis_carterae.AAC.2
MHAVRDKAITRLEGLSCRLAQPVRHRLQDVGTCSEVHWCTGTPSYPQPFEVSTQGKFTSKDLNVATKRTVEGASPDAHLTAG